MQDPSNFCYIVFQLGNKGFNTVKATLAAKEIRKRDRAQLPIKIIVEVNQVSLQQRTLGMEVERRTPSDIHRTGGSRPVSTPQPSRIDPVRRPDPVLRNRDVGRREPQSSSPLIPNGHFTANGIRPS